jgi:hypothetical protein
MRRVLWRAPILVLAVVLGAVAFLYLLHMSQHLVLGLGREMRDLFPEDISYIHVLMLLLLVRADNCFVARHGIESKKPPYLRRLLALILNDVYRSAIRSTPIVLSVTLMLIGMNAQRREVTVTV